MPAASSGGLNLASLPRPAALGAAWRYRVDPGSGEAGYQGNGTPAIARDPREVILALQPFGCARPPRSLPLPQRALEVSYRNIRTGAPGVALLLRFVDASATGQFFALRAGVLRSCVDASGIGAARVVIDVDQPGRVDCERTEPGPGSPIWRESMRIEKPKSVLLVALARPRR